MYMMVWVLRVLIYNSEVVWRLLFIIVVYGQSEQWYRAKQNAVVQKFAWQKCQKNHPKEKNEKEQTKINSMRLENKHLYTIINFNLLVHYNRNNQL